MLEEAIASSTSAGGTTSGASRNGAPLDVSALHLRDTIAAVVAEHWPGHGVLALRATPLLRRLTMWVEAIAGTPDEQYLLDLLCGWRDDIRQLLYPVHPVPLRGVHCLQCKAVTVPRQDLDGATVLEPALQAHTGDAGLLVACIACGTAWEGPAVHQYAS